MSSFQLTKSKIFLLFCLSFFAGVSAASFIFPLGFDFESGINRETGKGVLFLIAAIFLAMAAIFWKRKAAFVVFVCFLFAAAGFYRYADFHFAGENSSQIRNFNDLKSEVAVKGIVNKYPDFRLKNAKYEIAAQSVESPAGNEKEKSSEVNGKVLVTLGNYPRYEYGDELEISGKLVSPKNFATGEDSEAEFDYRSYLAKDGIYSLMNYPKVRVVSENQGSRFYRAVYSVKTDFEENLEKILPEPHSSFLAGLLLGSRGGISEDLKDAFAKTGVSHILAISGYNISVLVWFLASLLAFFYLSPRLVFWLSGAAIFVFVVLTGAEPSVIRAAIMGSLVLLARKEGRVYSVANAIVFAGAAMLFADPFILRYDAGFQLSFLATLGLILILPRLEKYFGNLPAALGLKEAFLATTSAQAAVLPLILYNFGNLSLVSVVTNVLILPAVPFAMFFGFLAGALSFIALPLGKAVGFFAWALLSYEIKIVEIFSAVPFGFFKISYFPIFLVILYYVGLIYFLFVRGKTKREEI